MKNLYLLLLCCCFALTGRAQTYGNEWINYTQKYYKFDVLQTGLHKIDYNTLVAAGIPVGSIQPSQFQIFGRDKEVPLYVVDNNDNSFDAGDYFVFVAKKNDGWIDSVIYNNPAGMANPSYNLINDTIHYFFSWKTSGPGLRYNLVTDTDYSSFTPINFVLKEVTLQTNSDYYDGIVTNDAVGSAYCNGEGYGFSALANSGTGVVTQNIDISTPQLYSGTDAPQPKFEFRSSSASNALSNTLFNHHLRVAFGPLELIDSSWYGYQQQRKTTLLPHNILSNGTSTFQFSIVGDVSAQVDRQGLTYANLVYNRLLNSGGLNSDNFIVLNNPLESKSRLDLLNFNSSNSFALYENGGIPRLQFATINSGTHQFLIPNSASSDRTPVQVFGLDQTIAVGALQPVNGTGAFTDYSMLAADSMLIMITHPIFSVAANNYKTYRQSMAGGSYPTVLVYFNELSEQFGGGVPMHPAATRRFVHYLYNITSIKPAALLLLGKGIVAFEHRSNAALSPYNLVPTLGSPGSDIAITSGLESTIYDPLIPTGRVSVNTNAELQNYLDKLIQYENYQNSNLTNFETNLNNQKQILHFVGGSDASQQLLFQGFMNNMKNIIEDSLYAGNVINYFKTSSNPLDPTVIAGVTDIISNGVSLMTFFGHAAASNNGFEINIDEPSNWNNQGKYPVVIGNSCHNGNLYSAGYTSTSEQFVNTPQEGAIAFVSSVAIGYADQLAYYSAELYRHFSNKNFGMPIGHQIKEAIRDLQGSNQNLYWETTYQQMALNGDPLIKLNFQRKPEISIQSSDISFSPTVIDLNTPEIAVQFKIKNLGAAINDSILVEVKRNFPQSSDDSLISFYIPQLNYDTIITKTFPLQPEISGGINQFTVSVDLPSMYQEAFEEVSNNTASANLFVPIGGINPIWPYNYAVVPYDTVTVKASTINPIASMNTYLFELDTTDTYDSPQLRRFSVTELGGVKCVPHEAWLNSSGGSFPLICSDSTVYFWRVAVDSSIINWTEFSFQYIPGKRGWGQDHFFQFKNNDFNVIQYNRNERLREWLVGQSHTLYAGATENYDHYENQWGIDGGLIDYATVLCGTPGIYVGVMDPITLNPWMTKFGTQNPTHDFGNGNTDGGYCQRNRAEGFFAFDQTDPAQLAAFENMIENEIPEGHYVAIYTTTETKYHLWDLNQPSLYSMFQDIGSTQVNNTQPEKPFAMIFKKGDPSSMIEKHFPDTTTALGRHGIVYVEFPFVESNFEGVEITPLIGPSFEWQTLYWRRDSLDLTSVDSVRIKIEQFNINQAHVSTVDTVFSPNDSILNLNSIVDADLYPYIRLNIYNSDRVNFTPAQIDRLHVLYSPVPEAAIDGTVGYYISPNQDTLQEGENINFAVDIRNISDYDMDSLLVNYRVEDANHVMHTIPYLRQGPLLHGAVLRDTLTFSTLDFPGYNGFWMEVNPYINGSLFITDQLEQFHFNNILYLPFRVDGDDEHPILDVTFDGRHILNGDIVNPESEILITLKDENPFLVMDNISDTTHFGIYITDPQGNIKRIPFIDGNGNVVMQWYPAEAQNKKFKILYPSLFTSDGTYTLLVQGSDRSGNISGDYEYKVTFEVIRESSITYLMNYPNPFSTSTRFVFTLTGTQEPEEVLIQVMTVTGRIVREITEDELGKIYIGRNITEFAWDGTDEFGDRLANGVYLYRVKAKIDGEDIKHRNSDADTYFKEEFGKMYLMR